MAAVAFHGETRQLALRPDSPAYATQLLLLGTRVIATANNAADTQAVRTNRVLAIATTGPAHRTDARDRARARPGLCRRPGSGYPGDMEDGFRVTYTVEAAQAVERLSPERRTLLDRGLHVLARDPYHKATAAIGVHEDNRKAQVAPGVLIEYVVAHAVMVVVVLTVFDESLYLLADSELGSGTDA